MSIGGMLFTAIILLLAGNAAESVHAQNRESTLAALTKLAPAERQTRIVEGAKKESGLVWYSSTTAEDALALSKKFHEQHPTIQINHFRSSSEKLLERILAESRANAFKADIVSLPELELSVMIKRKLLARYEGVENTLFPAESKDPHGFWTGLYTSAWVPAYNTKLVGKDAAPKSYKDLLNPKWKGGIAMDNEPYNWYIVSLRYLEKRDGKAAAADYMKKLAAQQMQWRKGHSLIGQLMSAGEFPLAAELQVHTVERAKAQGGNDRAPLIGGIDEAHDTAQRFWRHDVVSTVSPSIDGKGDVGGEEEGQRRPAQSHEMLDDAAVLDQQETEQEGRQRDGVVVPVVDQSVGDIEDRQQQEAHDPEVEDGNEEKRPARRPSKPGSKPPHPFSE